MTMPTATAPTGRLALVTALETVGEAHDLYCTFDDVPGDIGDVSIWLDDRSYIRVWQADTTSHIVLMDGETVTCTVTAENVTEAMAEAIIRALCAEWLNG